MTDKKTGCAVTGREKMLRYDRRRITLCCDRRRKIRRSLDIFSSEKMRDDTMGGQLLRNRGMTEREGNTGRR